MSNHDNNHPPSPKFGLGMSWSAAMSACYVCNKQHFSPVVSGSAYEACIRELLEYASEEQPDHLESLASCSATPAAMRTTISRFQASRPCWCNVCSLTAPETEGGKLKQCQCKQVVYCSETHQKQDWSAHKKTCTGTTVSTTPAKPEPQVPPPPSSSRVRQRGLRSSRHPPVFALFLRSLLQPRSSDRRLEGAQDVLRGDGGVACWIPG